MATTAEKVIRIDVVTSANAQRTIKALAADMKKVEDSTSSMQRSVSKGFGDLNGMLSKFGSFLGAFGLTTAIGAITRGVLDMASAYKILGDRFEGILGSASAARTAVNDISEIATTTGRELEGVAKLYEKSSRAALAYGLSTSAVKDITLGFSQALRLSGANTQEAYAALVQFGQALASGRLQGDELRSILENNSVFMYELAAAAGKTVSELRKMGSEGKLGPKELFDIMLKQGEDGLNMLQRIDRKAADIPLTFSQSATAVSSAMTRMIGEIAQALNWITDDKQGVFGALIRALDQRSGRINEMNRLNEAAGGSVWDRFVRFSEGFFGMKRSGPEQGLPSNLPFSSGGADTAFGTRVENEVSFALKTWEEGVAKLAAKQKEFDNLASLPFGAKRQEAMAPELAELSQQADELYGKYVGLRRLQSELRYGDAYKEPVKITTPDPEEERRLKSARQGLIDWIEAREREAAANKLVLDGNVAEADQAKDLAELRFRLKDAAVAETSALGMRAKAVLEDLRVQKELLDIKERSEKFNKEQEEQYENEAEKVRERINRDNAAIDALALKTRGSQEFVTDELERRRNELYTTLSYLSNFPIEDSPAIRSIQLLLDLYDQAIAKRKQLEDTQGFVKQAEAQRKIDAANQKRIDDEAESLNEDIKKAIINGDSGEALWETLRREFQDRTLDIVINPITSIISRALAQIADQFSNALTTAINLALANTQSDPLGALISLAGWSPGGAAGSTQPSIYALPTTGVKLGSYADGLPYVPYDEFPAILHKGERVLTAEENAAYTQPSMTITNAPIINIDSSTDEAKIVEYVARGMEESQRMMWMQFKARGLV